MIKEVIYDDELKDFFDGKLEVKDNSSDHPIAQFYSIESKSIEGE